MLGKKRSWHVRKILYSNEKRSQGNVASTPFGGSRSWA